MADGPARSVVQKYLAKVNSDEQARLEEQGEGEPATTDSTRYLVVGMTQGAYRIYQDATTHEERVIQPLGGVFYGSRSGLAPAAGAAPLTQFRQQLSAALETPIVIPKGTSVTDATAVVPASIDARMSF